MISKISSQLSSVVGIFGLRPAGAYMYVFVALGSVSSVPALHENEIIRGTSHGPVSVVVLLKRLNVGSHNALR